MSERTRVLVLESGSGLDIAGELGAVLGPGFEVSLVRAANRQTVELALDGAVAVRYRPHSGARGDVCA